MAMQRSKKYFLIAFIVFMLAVFAISYDIATKTTFPGSKGNLKERMTNPEEHQKTKTLGKQDSLVKKNNFTEEDE